MSIGWEKEVNPKGKSLKLGCPFPFACKNAPTVSQLGYALCPFICFTKLYIRLCHITIRGANIRITWHILIICLSKLFMQRILLPTTYLLFWIRSEIEYII